MDDPNSDEAERESHVDGGRRGRCVGQSCWPSLLRRSPHGSTNAHDVNAQCSGAVGTDVPRGPIAVATRGCALVAAGAQVLRTSPEYSLSGRDVDSRSQPSVTSCYGR